MPLIQDSEIQSIIQDAAAKVNAVFARRVQALITGATAPVTAPATTAATAPTVAKKAISKKTATTPAVAKPAAKKAPSKDRAPGEKRAPEELAKLTDDLFSYISKHPGQNMEQIGAGFGKPTSELNLPVKKLVAAKRLKLTGQKRATRYEAV